MKRSKQTVVRLVMLMSVALVPALAGCQDKLTPQLNPHPTHVVRITGRIPPTLQVQLSAGYGPGNGKDECNIHSWLQLADRSSWEKYGRSQVLALKRSGEHFETSFVVDKYLPGDCQWQFDGVGATVVRNGNFDDADVVSSPLITGFTYYRPNNQNVCIGKDKTTCEQMENSLDTPVVVPCEMFLYDKPMPGAQPGEVIPPDKTPSLFCSGLSGTEGVFKRQHLLVPSTKKVQIYIYDLEIEPDPTVAFPEKKEASHE